MAQINNLFRFKTPKLSSSITFLSFKYILVNRQNILNVLFGDVIVLF